MLDAILITLALLQPFIPAVALILTSKCIKGTPLDVKSPQLFVMVCLMAVWWLIAMFTGFQVVSMTAPSF